MLLTFNCMLSSLNIRNFDVFDFFPEGLQPYNRFGKPVSVPQFCQNHYFKQIRENLSFFDGEYVTYDEFEIQIQIDKLRDEFESSSWKLIKHPDIDVIIYKLLDFLGDCFFDEDNVAEMAKKQMQISTQPPQINDETRENSHEVDEETEQYLHSDKEETEQTIQDCVRATDESNNVWTIKVKVEGTSKVYMITCDYITYELTRKQSLLVEYCYNEKKNEIFSEKQLFIDFQQIHRDFNSDRLRDSFRSRPKILESLFKKHGPGKYSLKLPIFDNFPEIS